MVKKDMQWQTIKYSKPCPQNRFRRKTPQNNAQKHVAKRRRLGAIKVTEKPPEDGHRVITKISKVRKDNSAVDFCWHSPPGY